MWKMRLKIQKTLREYLSKIRNPTVMILSGCKRRLKTAKSFSVGRNRTRTRTNTATRGGHVRGEEEELDISAKLSDIDQFLAENFKSLYADESESEESEAPSRLSDSTASPEKCVALLTCSPDPELELRRSMKAMLESRARKSRQSMDWAFMEEILMCYLALNDKRSRGFVLGAFVDLVVELRSSSSSRRLSKKVSLREI